MHFALVGPMPPYRGGIAHFSASLAEALEGRGHAVSAVSFRRQYPRLLFPGQTEFEPGLQPPVEAPRLLDSVNPVSWERTARHLRRLGPDAVVFAHWMPFFGPAYGTVARRLGRDVRRITLVHNALPHERRPGDVPLSRYLLRACDGLLALSDRVRADLERLAPGVPVRQVPHPTYERFGEAVPPAEARAALGLPADAPVLLFFGFVRKYKGLDVLLEALPAVRERLPDARLVVAGEFYDSEAPYRERAARLGLAEAVRFDNRYVPSVEVPLYFSAADLVVQPYRSATQSGVAQVAFGFACPVVTTDVGGLAEAVPDGVAGLVVPPEEPAALARAVVRFFAEADLRGRLEAGARQQARDGGWAEVGAALEALAA